MPTSNLRITKETRVLGAIQIMTGVICNWLGLLWAYLLTTQFSSFGKHYIPLTAMLGYPLWSSVHFVFSGFFTVLLQRTPSKCLVCFTLACNVISACTAVTGLIFLTLELGVLGSVPDGNAHWPEKSGELLSQYLWLFVSLELVVTCIVIHWLCKAKYRT